jgi:hypothetical protein
VNTVLKPGSFARWFHTAMPGVKQAISLIDSGQKPLEPTTLLRLSI